MKRYLLFLLIPVLTGCFEVEPKLPQYFAKQEIDVAVDSVICFSGQEGFSHFILTCSTPFDSVHWFKSWYDNLQGFQLEYLGNDSIIEYSVFPHVASSFFDIICYGITGTDTTVYNLDLNYCGRNIYIPVAFSPNQDGVNDHWFPVYYFTHADQQLKPFYIHWEIRTLDGIKVFETDETQAKWDGTYKGHRMPSGSYLYYIELTISGEDPVEYSGWLELLG